MSSPHKFALALKRQMKNSKEMSFFLVEQCRLDLDALCRKPRTVVLRSGMVALQSLVALAGYPRCDRLVEGFEDSALVDMGRIFEAHWWDQRLWKERRLE